MSTGKQSPSYYDDEWQARAACANVDVDLFFPERGANGAVIAKIKSICFGCVVRNECLEYALHHNLEYGVWGGTTYRERLKLKKGERDATTRHQQTGSRTTGTDEQIDVPVGQRQGVGDPLLDW